MSKQEEYFTDDQQEEEPLLQERMREDFDPDLEEINDLRRQITQAKADNERLLIADERADAIQRRTSMVKRLECMYGGLHRQLTQARAALAPIVAAARDKEDFEHETWNPDAHIEITLTVAECRDAVEALEKKP